MPTLKDELNALRKRIEGTKKMTKMLLSMGGVKDADRDVGANIMLSYRHLEDARMRLGKSIQALGDGVSIYDKKKD